MALQTNREALIARYIEPDEVFSTPDRAWVADSSFHVATIIRRLQERDGEIEEIAEHYELPADAVHAVLAFYERHKDLFDARIRLEDAAFLDWERIDAESSTQDIAWIWDHIDFLAGMRTPYEARMEASGARVKTIIKQLQIDDWDIEHVAQARDLSAEAVRAAIAYYERHKDLIDAKILLDDAEFLDWERA